MMQNIGKNIVNKGYEINMLGSFAAISASQAAMPVKNTFVSSIIDAVYIQKIISINSSKLISILFNDIFLKFNLNLPSKTIVPEAKTIVPEAETIVPEAKTIVPGAETIVPEAKTIVPEAKTIIPIRH